jgi:uncharacterized Fe-S cluster-containing radical SAM superfamily protein
MAFDTVATRASTIFRKMGSFVVNGYARLRGRAFICETLQGDGHPGVCVTSDLMLYCGCRDTDGTGQLGDLTEVSFQQAFEGETAERFRRELAEGRIPTANCVRCQHLKQVSRAEAREATNRVKLPHSILVENTSACNLRCLSCRRDTVRKLRKRRMMSLDDIHRLALDIREMGVQELTYHHLGEPFLSKRLGDELRLIRKLNPEIRIQVSTNGMMLNTDAKREAALLFDHIQVSLDGVNQQMVERYQRGSHFETVYENMKQLVAYRDARGLQRPIICWKYLLFRWTEKRRHQLQAIELARDAKVDELWLEPTVSPFYGLPWRTMLGANRNLGIRDGRVRYVPVREQLLKGSKLELGTTQK